MDEITVIENKIDMHHLNNKIFKKNRQSLILVLTEVTNWKFEPLNNNKIYNNAISQTTISDNIIDSFDRVLNLIYKYSEHNDNDEVNFEDYNSINKLLDSEVNYKHIERLYMLKRNGILETKLYKNKRGIYFYPKDEITNQKRAHDSFTKRLSEMSQNIKDEVFKVSIKNCLKQIKILNEKSKFISNEDMRTSILDDVIFSNEIWDDIFCYFKKLNEIYYDQLDDSWDFEDFTLEEIKEVYYILATVSIIYASLSDCELLKITYEYLEKIILEKSNLNRIKINIIVDLLTYKECYSKKKISILSAPLIKLNMDNLVVITPNIVTRIKAEQSTISMLNKIEKYKKIYDGLSVRKESIMINLFKEKISKYDNIIISTNKKIPYNDREIDIALFDKISNTLLILEAKWLLPIGSAREALNRCQYIEEKGIVQIKDINQYAYKNIEDILNRCYGKKSLKVENYYACILTKNEIGAYVKDDKIKVIDEHSIYKLIEQYNGDLKKVMYDIDNEKYLPVKNKDYKEIRYELEYAGYKFRESYVVHTYDKEALKIKNEEVINKKKKRKKRKKRKK